MRMANCPMGGIIRDQRIHSKEDWKMKPPRRSTLEAVRDELGALPWDDSDLEELVAPRFGIITGFADLIRRLEGLRALDLGTTGMAGAVRPREGDAG